MELTAEEQAMLAGEHGRALRKAMEILHALGTIYGAQRTVPVESVQIAGVSYDNLGEAGLQFLDEMAVGGGRVRVPTTLNPAGMDIENWANLGIPAEFAEKQELVLSAFMRMGVTPTCTCTPYLTGNVPTYGSHIAWAESSAVAYANAILGARTNREGGPSALAAALTGRTPAYGYHLDENRRPGVTVDLQANLQGTHGYGALGKAVGEKLEAAGLGRVPYFRSLPPASVEELKSLCASIATYGGVALFHIAGQTPEANQFKPPQATIVITQADLEAASQALSDSAAQPVDFVSLGCPHLTLDEIARIAALVEGRQVRKEFWITTSRTVKHLADEMGYSAIIQASGAKFAVDTCCVVAPIKGRFKVMATDSAKACYYAFAKNQFRTVFMPFDQVVQIALGD